MTEIDLGPLWEAGRAFEISDHELSLVMVEGLDKEILKPSAKESLGENKTYEIRAKCPVLGKPPQIAWYSNYKIVDMDKDTIDHFDQSNNGTGFIYCGRRKTTDD